MRGFYSFCEGRMNDETESCAVTGEDLKAALAEMKNNNV